MLCAAITMVASPIGAQDGKKATVTGNVVDAACFMIHPDVATTPSHTECGEACVARGVPLAIVNEADGQLYFAADGKQLTKFHQKRVTATGTSVRKTEPMELKMPVGKTNEMAVKVTGGYNLLTIENVSVAPRK
jgi:hypothetical protein